MATPASLQPRERGAAFCHQGGWLAAIVPLGPACPSLFPPGVRLCVCVLMCLCVHACACTCAHVRVHVCCVHTCVSPVFVCACACLSDTCQTAVCASGSSMPSPGHASAHGPPRWAGPSSWLPKALWSPHPGQGHIDLSSGRSLAHSVTSPMHLRPWAWSGTVLDPGSVINLPFPEWCV